MTKMGIFHSLKQLVSSSQEDKWTHDAPWHHLYKEHMSYGVGAAQRSEKNVPLDILDVI